MYFSKQGFPEEGEIVMCTVSNVQYNSVFVRLDDYGKQGLIHISEVSPGRIRNIRDYVKKGKVVFCKVLRVNSERGHIDVSLRRVNESQRREKVEERKAEQKAENILAALATDLKEDPKKVYDSIAKVLLPKYEMLNYAFSDVVENNVSLEKLGLDGSYAKPLTAIILERIKPKEVSIIGSLALTSYEADGVSVVQDALVAAYKTSEQFSLRYLGAGSWKVIVTAPEFKEAESILKDALEKTRQTLQNKGEMTFTRKD